MEIGLYGKLPTHGDFLRRRVADDFVAAWDAWLQGAVAESRHALGDRWLETYLTSSLWRFVFDAGVCGDAAVAGVIAPSVDRVGRYFPLTLAWCVPPALPAIDAALRYQPVFEAAEGLLMDALAQEALEFADFDRRVLALSEYAVDATDQEGRLTAASLDRLRCEPGRPWRLPLTAAAALRVPALQVTAAHWQHAVGPLALWWTDGSSLVDPSWLITRGLPPAAAFSAMLDGNWQASGWEGGELETPVSPLVAEGAADQPTCRLRSAARSDPGPVRASNQDAFLERTEQGIWSVADGMGGLAQGELASRMVCDALLDVTLHAGLEEQIEAVIERLRQVNDYLYRAATREKNPVKSGSTVVVLLIREREGAVLWAGDSRAYRLRDGLVSQLSTDHSWAVEGEADAPSAGASDDSQVITRAVGVEDELVLDVVRMDVRPQDRFLLCSDGIARVLGAAELPGLLQREDARQCCAELIARSVLAGATDNMTAVVIDCVATLQDPPPASVAA